MLLMALIGVAYGADVFPHTGHDGAGDYGLSTYLWVSWLSIWGATIAYLQRIKTCSASFSWLTLLIEWITAPAAGVLAFWACEAAGVDRLLMASSVLVSGYAGKHVIAMAAERMNKE